MNRSLSQVFFFRGIWRFFGGFVWFLKIGVPMFIRFRMVSQNWGNHYKFIQSEFQDCSAICVWLRHLNPLLITLGGVHKLPKATPKLPKATPKITFSSWSLDHHGVSPLCFYQNYMEIMQETYIIL